MVERERLSALMDGELEESEAETHVRKVAAGNDLRECWETYHLIGDCLRGEGAGCGDISARMRAALEAEPTVLAPQRRPGRSLQRVRMYALSAAATVAGVAVVGWLAFQQTEPGLNPQFAQIAGSPASLQPVRAAAQVDDPEVDDYVRVHQEYSPTGAMHGVASYVRTVSSSR